MSSQQVDATLSMEMKAQGKMIIGGDMGIDKFEATLDLLGGTSGVKNFLPVFEKRFETDSSIEAAVSVALPVEMGIIVEVPRT